MLCNQNSFCSNNNKIAHAQIIQCQFQLMSVSIQALKMAFTQHYYILIFLSGAFSNGYMKKGAFGRYGCPCVCLTDGTCLTDSRSL